jgi:hypothetical protein
MRSKLPYILLAALFVGYILLEVLGPQPTNWNPSFERDKASPFGSELLYDRLPDIFPDVQVTIAEESPKKVLNIFAKDPVNYIVIQEEFKTDQFEARAMMDFVRRGNNVFIAASIFSGSLADSLDINNEDTFWDLFETFENSPAKDDYLSFDLAFDADQKHYPLMDNVVYNDFYTNGDEVLSTNKTGRTMFIRIGLGEGSFYLHSVPLMFTNYMMVDPVNSQYIAKSLSFLPVENVIWDEFFKPSRIRTDSPVGMILEQTSLRWAWFLGLSGVLLFMVFESKRKQRIIPVLEPVTNTTLEFTQTVGMLYHAHGDHKDICDKKIKFLLEYIRNRWGLSTTEFTSEFKEKLTAKSGVHRMEVEQLFTQIERIQKAKQVDEEALLQLSRWIDDFYVKSR